MFFMKTKKDAFFVGFKNFLIKVFKNRFIFFDVFKIISGVFLVYISFLNVKAEFKNKSFTSQGVKQVDNHDFIYVSVIGNVKNPGLIKLKLGSRTIDALKQAGPITKKGYIQNLNLSKLLVDGEQIQVFIDSNPLKSEVFNIESDDMNQDLKKVSLNNSSLEELKTLQGVGDSYAKKIIENRPYISIQEALDKKVITQSIYEKNKNRIEI